MKFVLLVAMTVFFTSCASHGNKIDIDYVKGIRGGITSETDILANMGEPTIDWPMQAHGKKMVYIYAYSSVKDLTAFCSLFGGLPCFKTNYGANTKVQMLTIYLDNSGLVLKLGYQINGVETELIY